MWVVREVGLYRTHRHPWIRRLGASVIAWRAVVGVAGVVTLAHAEDSLGRATARVDRRDRRRLIHAVLKRCTFGEVDGVDVGGGHDEGWFRDVALGDGLLA